MVGLVDYALTDDEEDEVVAESRGAKRAHAAVQPAPDEGVEEGAGAQPPVVCKSLFADTANGFWRMETFLTKSNHWTAAQHAENEVIYKETMKTVTLLRRQRQQLTQQVQCQQKAFVSALVLPGEEPSKQPADVLRGLQAQRAALCDAIRKEGANAGKQLAALDAEIEQLEALDTGIKDLAALEAVIKRESEDAAVENFKAVNKRKFIAPRWHFLLRGPGKLVVQNRYPDSFADPRGNRRNKSPLDLLAHIDLHNQSAERVNLIFRTFAEVFLSLYGWVVLITGRGAHSKELTPQQVREGALTALKRHVLKVARMRGVGVTYYASSPGVMLVITHELYKQALERGITFAAPAPGFAA
ncbi:hypothetical protein JKP88DRAFT_276394 [Tribonema minus]|uniref:Smr domain-containing protein n=1 Tax=Tribonema minus TaxID=303371 RepID=A0A835Z213_9STRA|nr:hypothetical protein JKP88DRAFT_276394 [Tribonema minus]